VLNRDLWEQLDRARLPGLRLQHVRGHSGDPDNDRCDAIAVAFSRGQLPALAMGDPAVNPATTATKANPEPEAAPPALQQLLSRLELADRLAAGGYTLTAVELARLVELPLRGLEGRSDAWIWRDWRVCPAGEGRWRLERQADAGGLGTDA
jgi:ribonuclease HI